MKRRFWKILFIVLMFLGVSAIIRYFFVFSRPSSVSSADTSAPTPVIIEGKATSDQGTSMDVSATTIPVKAHTIGISGFVSPLQDADGRVTKKPFGIFITKATSPVQPERFSGYHTGSDFETFPDESDADVLVSAVCSGKLVSKRTASGYGGIAVESCMVDGSPIMVVYGHVRLSSIRPNVGDTLNAGDTIGVLGAGFSTETDGERKHLHLGMHKGTNMNILGYVRLKAELADWIDPCSVVCHP